MQKATPQGHEMIAGDHHLQYLKVYAWYLRIMCFVSQVNALSSVYMSKMAH